MVSSVNSHTSATRIGRHLWEIDLRFAPGLPPGWERSPNTLPPLLLEAFPVAAGVIAAWDAASGVPTPGSVFTSVFTTTPAAPAFLALTPGTPDAPVPPSSCAGFVPGLLAEALGFFLAGKPARASKLGGASEIVCPAAGGGASAERRFLVDGRSSAPLSPPAVSAALRVVLRKPPIFCTMLLNEVRHKPGRCAAVVTRRCWPARFRVGGW